MNKIITYLLILIIITGCQSKNIGIDKAKQIALSHSGIEETSTTSLKCELDHDENKAVYEISFIKDTTEYKYTIDAKSGDIIEFKQETQQAIKTDTEAKEIALKDAKLSESTINNYTIELDNDNNIQVYNIKFDYQQLQYHYIINAIDLSIIEKNTTSINTSTSNQYITHKQVKTIVINDCKVTDHNYYFSKIKLENKHNVTVYDVEFHHGNIEYDYIINATDGSIIEVEKETHY